MAFGYVATMPRCQDCGCELTRARVEVLQDRAERLPEAYDCDDCGRCEADKEALRTAVREASADHMEPR